MSESAESPAARDASPAREKTPLARVVIGRGGATLFAAALGGVVAALLDARFARAAETDPPAFGSILLADIGLMAPVALAIGIGVAALSLFLHPSEPPSVGALLRALGSGDERRRARLSVALPIAGLVGAIWVVLAARIALAGLASSAEPKPSAAAIVAGVLLLGVVLWAIALGATELLSPWLEDRAPHPALGLAIGLAAGLGLLGYAIASGETSGAGGTLAVFGVFKRPELDLRAPGLLLIVALAAYLGAAPLARLPALVLAAAALLPLGLTFHAARSLDPEKTALALERSAPLGKIALGRLRKLGDRDKDGASASFAGGDCDDASASIGPHADDIPANGIDEDCSGRDAEKVDLGSAVPEAPKDAREWALSKLPEKLNVILITVDTLRYDLGYMGYERKVSPNIDALAKRSTVFENAYALASYTSKSLAPMLIGKYGSETHRGWSHFNRFEAEDVFVQERLSKAGIRTISVQGYWYFFHKGYGFERGFDVVDSSAAPKAIQMEGDRTVTADKVSDAAIAQLEKPENTSRQFFMWAHYVDPHTEYVRHEGFDFGASSRDAYDSEVAFTDHHVGRLLDFVQKSKLADRTAIVFSSDHGEAFGEHGMIRHGFEIWEELVRVPLIVHVPGAKPQRISVRRGAIDVVPTILDLFRQPAPSGKDFDFVSGQSLLLDVMRPPGYEPKPRIVFVDMTAGPNNAERQAFIEDGKKLVVSSGRPLGLYDLEADPGEKKSLLDDAELKERLLSRYKAFRRELREVVVKPIPK
jgi:arylsulfatase A-like enzyme